MRKGLRPPPVTKAADPITRARRKAKRLAKTAPVRAKRLAHGARVRGNRVVRRGYVPGLVSIVVPCYNVEEFLDECLVSLRFQNYGNVEIIVVDDGSPDRVAEIARHHARRDLRVRLVQRENGGLSAARNTGVEHARGEFLTFIDSDDVVSPRAFNAVVDALRESGSDFAISCYDRLENKKRVPAGSWIRQAHAVRRLGETLETFPEAMVNAVAWSKTYRREFWDEAGLSFPEGKLYEDQPVSMEAFAKARAFDVVPDIGVSWRIRLDRSSISQKSWSVENMEAHNDAVRTSFEALRAGGHERAVEIRALQLISFNMPFFTRHIARGGPEFWTLLREGIADLVEHVSREDFVRSVGAQDKVLLELIMADRRDAAIDYIENWGSDLRRFPTHVTPDGVRVDLPLTEGLPEDVSLLADRQLELVHRVMRLYWADDVLTIGGWAFVRNLDLADNPPAISLALVHPDGTRVALDVETRSDPRIDVAGGHWHCDYRNGGFAATLSASDVPSEPGDWVFELTFEAGGITRTTRLTEHSTAGSPVVPQTHIDDAGNTRTARRNPDGDFVVRVAHWDAWARRVAIDSGRVTVEFQAQAPEQVVIGHIDHPGKPPFVTERPTSLGDGWWSVSLDLSTLPTVRDQHTNPGRTTRPMRLRVRHADGEYTPLLATNDVTPSPGVVDDPTVVRRLTRAKGGELEVLDRVPVVTDLELTDTELVCTVHSATPIEAYEPILYTRDNQFTGTVEPQEDGSYLVRCSLVTSRWSYHGLTIPKGKYAVSLRAPGDARRDDLPLTPSSELLDRMPLDLLRGRLRGLIEVYPNKPPVLALNVQEPLADDERGQRNQHRLRVSSQVERAERDSVFFRALYSEVANCNMLGVHHELRRRGSDLTLYWSIRDHSVPVPEGGTAIVEGTREWHEALAQSRYVMVNVHQPDWFVKPEGQVVIETMHGYPYKVMGHEWWEKGGFPAGQVKSFDRRAREWDYFVSPASYATPLLRKAFLEPAGSKAEVLEIGYPRNDVLQGEEAERLRTQVRRDLGVRDDQVVVMYAPTFRDYLSADDMAAERVDFLDVDRAARELGDKYVVLVRGHAFNARAGGKHRGDGTVIDVTTHPDVNDLIVASDVAILDYSSLRFDYAITRKPMIFLVPDLERYNAVRGGVIPYEPTAPGPHVKSTREVVALLKNFDALTRSHHAEAERFRREYVDLDDGHASARLVDAVFVPRGDAPPAQG